MRHIYVSNNMIYRGNIYPCYILFGYVVDTADYARVSPTAEGVDTSLILAMQEKYKHLVRHNLVTSCENDSSAVQSNGRGSIEHHDPSPDQFVGAQGSVDSRPPVDPLQADNLRQGIHPPPIAVPAYPVNYEDVSLRQDHKGPWYHIPDRIINPQHGLVPEQYAGIGLIAGSQHYAVPPQHFGSAHVARSHHHMWPQQYTGLEHTSRAPYLRPSNVDSQNLPGPQNHSLSKHRQDVQSNVNASPSTKEPLKSTKQKKPSNNRKGMVPGHKYRTYQQRCSACNGRRNSCLRLAECPPRP